MPTKGKQVQVTLYLPPELARGLKLLSVRTRVPQNRYLREAVEGVLSKYATPERDGRKRSAIRKA